MNLRRILTILLIAAVIGFTSLVAAWRLFGGRDHFRAALVEFLQPNVGPSLVIDDIAIGFSTFVIRQASLNLSSRVEIEVEAIKVRISLFKLLFNGVRAMGTIETISVVNPLIIISAQPADSSTTLSTNWVYQPHPLKSLTSINSVRRIRLKGGRVKLAENGETLINSIIGQIDLTETDEGRLTLNGDIPRIPGADLTLTGTADLTLGDFALVVTTLVNDLGSAKIDDLLPTIKIDGGRAQVELHINGSEDLTTSGSFEVSSLSGSIANQIALDNGEFSGELFGRGLNIRGALEINGVQLPVAAAITDVLGSKWTADIETSDLDLSTLKFPSTKTGLFNGNVDLILRAQGDNRHWEANLSASSDSITIGAMRLQNLNIVFEGSEAELILKKGQLEFFNGQFLADGAVNWDSGTNFQWDYYRAADTAADQSWRRVGARFGGRIRHDNESWYGQGEGEVFDVDSSLVFTGSMSLADQQLSFYAIPYDKLGFISLSLFPKEGDLGIQLRSVDPHLATRRLLPDKSVPEILNHYTLDLSCTGTVNEFEYSLDWQALKSKHGGKISGRVMNAFTSKSTSRGNLDLRLPRFDGLTGHYSANRQGNTVHIVNLSLNSIHGTNLLTGMGEIDLESRRITAIDLQCDYLPAVDIITYLYPGRLFEADALISAHIVGGQDSVGFSGELDLMYPNESAMKGVFSGILEKNRIEQFELSITDIEQTEVLRMNGALDLENDFLDSISLHVEELPLSSLLYFAAPKWVKILEGNLNLLIEMDGPFDNLNLAIDSHLRSGRIRDREGYWANLRCTSNDSVYNLERFDFGQDVTSYVVSTGWLDRRNGAYRASLTGSGARLGEFIETLTGVRRLAEGEYNLDVRLAGGDVPQSVDIVVDVNDGKLGPVAFSNLNGSLGISGFDTGDPKLLLEKLNIDWDVAHATVTGSSKLSGEYPCSFQVEADGNLLEILPRISSFISHPQGSGQLWAELSGSLYDPYVSSGKLELVDGAIRLNSVVKKITDVRAVIHLDSSAIIEIGQISGKANGREFNIRNRRVTEIDTRPAITMGDYDLGVIQFSTESNGVWAVIPSFMDKNWGGFIAVSGPDGKGFFEFFGPNSEPFGTGEVYLRNATFTYPFMPSANPHTPFVRKLVGVLSAMEWDARLFPEQNCTYKREISGMSDIPVIDIIKRRLSNEFFDVDIKLYVDLQLDDDEKGLDFTGSVDDTLHISGDLNSSRGAIEYLDLKFTPDKLGVVFNPADPNPLFYGQAVTSVVDSLNIPRDIRMILVDKDLAMNQSIVAPDLKSPTRWEDLTFVLQDDEGHSQEQILALLGYSPENIIEKLPGLSGLIVANITPLKSITDYLETRIERYLGFDYVYIEPTVASNVIHRTLSSQEDPQLQSDDPYSYLRTFDRSRLTVGKYLTRNIYLSYTGSLMSESVHNVTRLGVVHEWDVLIRMMRVVPGLSLNYRYEYSTLVRESQLGIFLRYSMLFDLSSYRLQK